MEEEQQDYSSNTLEAVQIWSNYSPQQTARTHVGALLADSEQLETWLMDMEEDASSPGKMGFRVVNPTLM